MNSLSYALRSPARPIALITMLALLAWTLGLPAWIHTADAATLLNVSDTLSNGPAATLGASAPGADAAHRIKFTTPTGMTSGQNMRITFDPTGSLFNFTGFLDSDVYVVAGANKAPGGTCGAGVSELDVTVAAGYIDFDVCSGDTIAPGSTLIIDVGTSTGGNLINNPTPAAPVTPTSYVVRIAGQGATPIADSGDTRVVVLDAVTVTASVDTIFTFSVNPVGQGVTVNNSSTVGGTSGTTTATSVPFGTIAPGTAKELAQTLRVDTNALNGFSVTVQADQTLTAGNAATIDEFLNGAGTASSTLWAGPAGTMGNTDTYGHWGVTSDDDVVSSTTPNKWGSGYATYQGNFIDNPVEVFYHNTAVNQNAGVGIGSTTVAYKVEIMALQEAAKDYTATLTYIATPVF